MAQAHNSKIKGYSSTSEVSEISVLETKEDSALFIFEHALFILKFGTRAQNL